MPQTKEIAKIDEDSKLPIVKLSGYRALDADPERVTQILKENLAGGITEFDLERVKVPSGGGTAWEVPTLEGPKNVDEITGVMIWYRDARTYWNKPFDEGGSAPPDCSSSDTVTGIGTPGGACQTCPLSQFGSADKGQGQACRQIRQLFILMPDSIFPMVITAPPTSLRAMKNYSMKLSGALVNYFDVTTTLTLEKDKSADGIVYAKIVPKAVSRLTAEQSEAITLFREPLIDTLKKASLAD